MNYFDNPNQIQLLQKESHGLKPGLFVHVNGKELNPLGLVIRPIIRDIRPVAMRFDHHNVESSNDPETQWFQETVIMSQSRELHCAHGVEVAMEIDDKMYTMTLLSIVARQLIPTLSELIGYGIMLETAKVESYRHSWYQMKVWVPASAVQSYVKLPDYDDNEYEEYE